MQTLKNKKILFLISFFTLIFSTSFSYGADNKSSILVVGSGAIIKENLADARRLAISDAHAKGIEAYLERSLGSQGMVNNFKTIINEIIPGSTDVIQNFHILAEDAGARALKILVSITVNEKLMEERLLNAGIITFENTSLRTLFLVADNTGTPGQPYIWWDDPENKINLSGSELILYRFFQERGFDPVYRVNYMPESGYNPELFKAELTDEEAVLWGELFLADLVVTGRVDKDSSNALIADIKAIQVENRETLGTYLHEQPYSADEADLENLLADGVSVLVPSIIRSFKKSEETLISFDLAIKGLTSLRQVTGFISFLKEKIGGVIAVLPSRISTDVIMVTVEYTGERKTFIEKIRANNEMPFAAQVGIDEEGYLTVTAL
ncbi:MAG: hypothetical protein GX846_04845 [Deltaproteobacteria bacterium]|nr:hypothetical protein [Deltaproteobacteria bacterium]